jgi:purine-nucleoside phosphorylase
MPPPADALGRVAAFHPRAAVIFGSGLAALPPGAALKAEIAYEDLGWPSSAVPGHRNVLQLVELAAVDAGGLRLALACCRPHGYEGRPAEELERPVRCLAAAGVSRFVLTNSCGALRPTVVAGEIVACTDVVDLQAPPLRDAAVRLEVCATAEAQTVAGAVAPLPAQTGVYVAVAGPQFETPAEAAWLARYGDVVGMSGAPEVRAARAAGAACCLLALVVNRAAAVGSHDDVLAVGGQLAGALAAGLGRIVSARWPRPV